jgi:carboxymethylenebutenolidase
VPGVSVTTRYETIAASTADGGGEFEAFCAVPEGGRGPGILLFQEIFGINDNMRTLAERLAAEGYVVLVPDMFWRLEKRFERKDESGLGDAFAMVQRFDMGTAIIDIQTTHAHLLGMAECTGKVGAVGFCLGGGLAFAAATTSRVDGHGIDAAVCYYGSPVNDLLGHVGNLECPTLFHYGDDAAFIPEEKIAEVEAAVAGKDHVTVHRYAGAGHAFSNWDAPSMYQQEAADLAWDRTLAFFREQLQPS